MATSGTALVSTLSVFASWQTFAATTTIPSFRGDGAARIHELFDDPRASLRAAHRAGVRIAAGTDCGGGSPRANHLPWEVQLMVKAGLEPFEALAAVTWRGGQLLDETDAGVLREGGPADLVLVHGDPLSDPAALWRVWRVSW